ncbi:hypothetical protein IscW_ISCW007987 [Ixodes scapularis]|uniref:Uncharacterized protein n=1 Tax=Ixodes scapularis TaxID=6945 RepID=B7PTV4_IXOSC|nr:hypothetical protein IscW_ISCW007987 [Ixodes scapularis]|eukprot:XP_002404962.1 hypothetical protein IscW_ISCW007987 [Ixodes scapularis]
MAAGVAGTVAAAETVVAKRSPSFEFASSGTTTALSWAMETRNRVGVAVWPFSLCLEVGEPGGGSSLREAREMSGAGVFRLLQGWEGRRDDELAC